MVLGKRRSRPWIVSDELWSLIEPLLPEQLPKQVEGRPRVPGWQALCGILFVLHTGIQWEYLPQELGFGSGMTCWRRLAAWNEAGGWDQLHQPLLNKLRSKNQLDWSRVVIDSSHVRPTRKGPKAEPARSTERSGHQTPPHHRRPRDPARGVADWRKPQATSPNSCRCWTRSRPWPESSADRAGDPTCSSPTAATTTTSTADSCGNAESGPRSPNGDNHTAPV
ncbi:hypothetical protein DMH26_00450 [Streptomyces sp. WAC 05379]|nr:hypothetical protein DMH26_00450 [Streptomyces sp. WAC 05379]